MTIPHWAHLRLCPLIFLLTFAAKMSTGLERHKVWSIIDLSYVKDEEGDHAILYINRALRTATGIGDFPKQISFSVIRSSSRYT